MSDVVERLGRSQIQHGKSNDRIYLMKLDPAEAPRLVPQLDQLARNKGYTKIFAKVPARARPVFALAGYREEAAIPGFFGGREDAAFFGKYFCERRRRERKPDQVQEVIDAARAKAGTAPTPQLENGYRLRPLGPRDAEAMAALYREVFASYPFPIHDPAYLRQTMDENILYWGVEDGSRLAAISSAETYAADGNAEMTDFATLPAYRGAGFAQVLLARMEEELNKRGYRTAYTIARAYSFGMNITFAKHGYRFSGTLTHNTDISGELESMNVWYKPLDS
ncbi:putative beta-lysine N-acetyltransferase [Geoalkalibacter halelectricus]|uniref:Beta-lysine N-acetyltransferase n=1 Tax=Geoalkalibacter halelectricus TaxID=2847045 RepID=A0ABY5ZR80_9BACT|nr:putative beta-lysine N-acetyltransferase [Geoalkalibacter halelectricus]MDO3376968.1 putative beta-lysine N-acetyltransferase [Geoalkalibacter halelectricus]UWZ81191.1 putative beta-lysine N-acetyltransferase [Geoalkalibacter halelectricus]